MQKTGAVNIYGVWCRKGIKDRILEKSMCKPERGVFVNCAWGNDRWGWPEDWGSEAQDPKSLLKVYDMDLKGSVVVIEVGTQREAWVQNPFWWA